MKSLVCVLSVVASATALAESHWQNILDTQFRQMAEECQMDVDKRQSNQYLLDISSASQEPNLKSCYANKVQHTFRELRFHLASSPRFYGTYVIVPGRVGSSKLDEFIQAAVKADPVLALTAFNAVLKAHINVYTATKMAQAALPERAMEFSQLAIASGAEPSRITAATAAGKSTQGSQQ